MYEEQQQQLQQQIQRPVSPVRTSAAAAAAVSERTVEELNAHFTAMAVRVAEQQPAIDAARAQVDEAASRLDQLNRAKARAAAFTNAVENTLVTVMGGFSSGPSCAPAFTYTEEDRLRDAAALADQAQHNAALADVSRAQKQAGYKAHCAQKDLEIEVKGQLRDAERHVHAAAQADALERWAQQTEASRAERKRKERERADEIASLTAPSAQETAAKAHPSVAYRKIQCKRLDISRIEGEISAEDRNISLRAHDAKRNPTENKAKLANSATAAYLRLQNELSVAQKDLQHLPQRELIAHPEEFLRHIMLSPDLDQGIKALYPGIPASLRAEFINSMGCRDRHWFVLAPDAAREQKGFPAFVLTPALEKYSQEFPDDELLTRIGREGTTRLPAPDNTYIAAAYVPYKTGKPKSDDFEHTIGNTQVRRAPDPVGQGFSPDFVFTAGMNGCAYAVTQGKDPEHFTAWHFQSPGSNKTQADTFKEGRRPMDWFGHDEYESAQQSGLYEATNLLWRGPDGWQILSQETKYSHLDRSAVHGMQCTGRPLNLGD